MAVGSVVISHTEICAFWQSGSFIKARLLRSGNLVNNYDNNLIDY
jgi:hypothetical protein